MQPGHDVEAAKELPCARSSMVVDCAMPGLNGAEVAEAALARLPRLAIIFASGYADTAAIAEAARENAWVLRKPFRMEELQRAVDAALRR